MQDGLPPHHGKRNTRDIGRRRDNYKKSEPDAHPDPKYALEGYTKEGQHLRIVFAVPTGRRGGESSLVVVTCIELGVEWQCDCH